MLTQNIMACLATLLVVLLALLPLATSDTPANCTYEDIRGTWTLHVGEGGHENTLDCTETFDVQSKVTVTLSYPDIAKDDQGNTGFWTIIYNQGFEVVVNKKKYFAFSNYTMINKTAAASHCSSTLNGWAHNVDESDWACYYGVKESSDAYKNPKIAFVSDESDLDSVYVKNEEFIKAINNQTDLWKAVHYPEMEGMTLRQRLLMAGGVPRFGRFSYPETASVRPETKLAVHNMSTGMDWRDMKGVSYVTPIRNQGQCGSCYAFASMAMLESRLMIDSKMALKKVFSPQDVVSCSEYAQGCEGGFPYLIAGKYAEDFGLVEEACFPYRGSDSRCSELSTCRRYRATDYKYVGGYFGACSEEEMIKELQYGPVSVAFEVTSDFMHYKSGIYHQTGLADKFNPFRITNHAVLAVGYAEDNGVKYWIVKNSWGTSWGEEGYFRIRRGSNELNIESMAVVSKPVIPE